MMNLYVVAFDCDGFFLLRQSFNVWPFSLFVADDREIHTADRVYHTCLIFKIHIFLYKVSFIDHSFPRGLTGFSMTTVCCLLLTALARSLYISVFISEAIRSVGFSSDGGTIVSVDEGSGQNVVAFDAVSGWKISTLVIPT